MVGVSKPEANSEIVPPHFEQSAFDGLRRRRVHCQRVDRHAATELPRLAQTEQRRFLGARQELSVREVPILVQ